MTIKNNIFRIIILLQLFFISCIVEKESSVDYIITNKTSYEITIVRYGKWDYNFENIDTIYLSKDSEFLFNYYGKGGAFPPFYGTDSLTIKYGDFFVKKYTPDSIEKNPLKKDFYSGGEVDSKRFITYYEFNYKILDDDFTNKTVRKRKDFLN